MEDTQHHPDVLMIGLDGLEPTLVERWSAEGRLPTLTGLMERGVFSRLRSTTPPATAPAWTTVLTGANEGKHGVYDFRHQEPGTYQVKLVHAGLCSMPTMWHYLSEAGVSFASLEVPGTYPPPQLSGGVIVSGFQKPGFTPEACVPHELHAELTAAGIDQLHHYHPVRQEPFDWSKFERTLEERRILADHVLSTVRPRVFFQVLMPTDHFAHQYFGHESAPLADGGTIEEPLRQVYEAVDRAVGERLERWAGLATNVILLSDHGFYREDFLVSLSAWLRENGYLSMRATRNLLSARLRKFAKRVMPSHLRHALGRSSLGRAGAGRDFAAQFDWENTRAFCWGAGARIRINLRGREPRGTVEPGAEYEDLRDELIERLEGLAHPKTGQSVFKRMWRREELYHGPRVEEAPDLVGELGAHVTVNSNLHDPDIPLFFEKTQEGQRLLRGVFDKPLGRGNHSPLGTLMLVGPAFEAGAKLDDMPGLSDIAPTALYLAGLGVPGEMDGSVPAGALTQQWREEHPVREAGRVADREGAGSSGYTEAEQEQVSQRLRDLGYL